ncbi:MAG: immunoglobulin domain-containing protein [Verrucomicrobiota bacterium]
MTSARTEDINAQLLGAPYPTNSATFLYASFTVHFTALPTSGGSYFAHFNSTSFRGVIWAKTSGAPNGFFRLGIGNTTAALSVQLTNNLVTNQAYFVVARYGLANGLSTIWLNPIAETNFSVTSFDSPSPTPISAFSFRQSTGIGTMLIDDLIIGTSFADVVSTNSVFPPFITTQPQSQAVFEGATATFTVVAGGTPPLSYQWQFNGNNLTNVTGTSLSLSNVVSANAGNYSVIVSNAAEAVTSDFATLTVNFASALPGLSILTYNTKGNGATNWTTNAPQVQAIGRQMQFLQPDIITFQEIPLDLSSEMTNFVKAYLPGYSLARNSGTDGFIRSVIASRFPITRSTSWLNSANLNQWGYTNTNSINASKFTRDLFEAQINVPGFSQPLHVFTTHLKSSSGGYADAAAKRAAEAAAITNFFATNFFIFYPSDPYFLSGDMNEANTNAMAIQRLLSASAGLRLTNPTNPISGSINTFSIQASLSSRIDYIFPCGVLFSNIVSSQVFRTDLLNPVPPGIQTNDSKTASDHLPVLMTFSNPYTTPFQITSLILSNQLLTLNWQSSSGRQYRVESSTTLTNWVPASATLTATGTNLNFTTNKTGSANFLRVYRFP